MVWYGGVVWWCGVVFVEWWMLCGSCCVVWLCGGVVFVVWWVLWGGVFVVWWVLCGVVL